jgi:hypothetical protein
VCSIFCGAKNEFFFFFFSFFEFFEFRVSTIFSFLGLEEGGPFLYPHKQKKNGSPQMPREEDEENGSGAPLLAEETEEEEEEEEDACEE